MSPEIIRTPARSSGQSARGFLGVPVEAASPGEGAPEPPAPASLLAGTTAEGGVRPVQPTTTSVASDRPTASVAGQREEMRGVLIGGSWGASPASCAGGRAGRNRGEPVATREDRGGPSDAPCEAEG